MMKKEKTIIELEQGWEILQKGITKLKNILEGTSDSRITSEDYMILYEAVYTMGTQKPPHNYSKELYDRYRETIEEYILTTVLPAIREKHEEVMLQEFVKRWSNHKVMVHRMSRFFHYLDRFFAERRSLPSLNEVGFTCFLNLVYKEMNGRVSNAIISLINKEREGDQIDRALVKNVLDVFVEMGRDSMDYYVNDFEEDMLQETASYYSSKASSWILKDSCPEYMLKVEECLNREKDRVTHYLHCSSERKLMQKVEDELLYVHASQLLENEHSGCLTLLRDNKRDDLSRMFRLFNTIGKGLYTMSLIFKEHVRDEGMVLVKHTGYAATNKEISTRKLAELHDKYLDYVVNCFQNHSLFHKSLEESFEAICSKRVKGEILALDFSPLSIHDSS